jgi:DNA-directed RNA polymerase specialized sigma24 family protein/ribosome-associated translation inhibitor RaiA
MNVHISYKVRRTPDIDNEIQHWTEKIERRLQVFRPELIHLKGLVEQNSPREGFSVSLNLRLPSGQMAAQESASAANAAIKAAFSDLLGQIGRHKDLLRNSHRRKRNVKPDGRMSVQNPSMTMIPAAENASVSIEEIRVYINVNFTRLERFVERELGFRETSGDFPADAVSAVEVVDEVTARALDDRVPKPDLITIEPWLYRLAIEVMEEFATGAANSGELTFEGVLRRRDERASDEPRLQFHQPDEAMTTEGSIRDERASSPEEIAYTDEIVGLINFGLRDAEPAEREAFILNALEGFSAAEIASITDQNLEQVRTAIAGAREKLRHTFPAETPTKKRVAKTGTE